MFSEQGELLVIIAFKFIFWPFLYYAHICPWKSWISVFASALTLFNVAFFLLDFSVLSVGPCLHGVFQSQVGRGQTCRRASLKSLSLFLLNPCLPRNAWWPIILSWHRYISKDAIDLSVASANIKLKLWAQSLQSETWIWVFVPSLKSHVIFGMLLSLSKSLSFQW